MKIKITKGSSSYQEQVIEGKCPEGESKRFRLQIQIQIIEGLSYRDSNVGKLFCCFIDFQKAFDSIWHDGLLHKLLYKNIGGQFYHLISDMYLKTKCAVKNGNKRSSFFD